MKTYCTKSSTSAGEIVATQVEAIKNLKIDKITVWDSGSAGSSSTANFTSNLIKTLPPLHEIAKMASVELPAKPRPKRRSPVDANRRRL